MPPTPHPRLLTKSRFKLATECPTKLYYTGKDAEYGNAKTDDAFLKALAEGGFQVGALAQLYYPGGHEIGARHSHKALAETQAHLAQAAGQTTLYEAAFTHAALLVRVDIFVKKGNQIQLYEVKAKSFDFTEADPFYNKTLLKKGVHELGSAWKPYLLDIAFQAYVVRKAFPDCNVTAHLLLADKGKVATVDGLNQRFFLTRTDEGRTSVTLAPGTTAESLGAKILTPVNVDAEVALILGSRHGTPERSFDDYVAFLSDAYARDARLPPQVGPGCKGCEFRIGAKEKAKGLKSGFDECWEAAHGLTDAQLSKPMIFDLWNFRKTAKLFEEGRFFIAELEESDIGPKPRDSDRDGDAGISSSERQWLQAEKVIEGNADPYIDLDGLRAAMSGWTYPLHLIDFETTMVAIPFNAGRRPYEQTAFQFSHHVMTQDGRVEHRTQYIHRGKGEIPNFGFVRALKKALETDQGTIFRYATHENTVLCQIYRQLADSQETDRTELMAWIKTVTQSGGDSTEVWEGSRNMIDLCELVKRYFYHPYTRGSNSIKRVLPAILQSSRGLEEKYGRAVYGAVGGPVSLNFKDWAWIKRDADGALIDPYKLLPPIFSDLDLETMDSLITDGSIADGGAAMTAYARMQFTQISDAERDRVCSALLKYCELDTFAMVLIVEYWQGLVDAAAGVVAAPVRSPSRGVPPAGRARSGVRTKKKAG